MRERRQDDPNGNLGMTIHMDGEPLSIAQKEEETREQRL